MAGRKPGEADGTLTVQCEWFPVEAAAARQPDVWRRVAVRTVFNRLVEAMARKPESATTVTTVAERAAASCAAHECRGAQVRLLPTAPRGANLRPKGAKAWSGGRVEDRAIGLYTFF